VVWQATCLLTGRKIVAGRIATNTIQGCEGKRVNTVNELPSQRVSAPKARGPQSPDYDVVIVGAGPYGLSAGAHLKAQGLGVCVFGEPMDFWANKMPAGMLLRSPREASSIADPQSAYTLEGYEKASGAVPTAPVPLETFVDYGRWFQNQLGPDLDRTGIQEVRRENSTFKVTLENGAKLLARRVVVAAGVGPFSRKPPVFQNLPRHQASHCYEGKKIAALAGKRVAVIGAGQSALESAALLSEAGAAVEVIAAIPQLRWIGMHKWLHQLGPISKALYSKWDVGPVGISRLVSYPKAVSYIPLKMRDRIRVRAVRPAGSRWLPDRLKSVTISTGRSVRSAKSVGDEVRLLLDDNTERRVDHVLMGTGYDVDIDRYSFLPPELLSQIQRLGGYPDLSSGFCTSVPGLHFIGATASRSFGPLLCFVAGTGFASKELTSYISRHRAVK
jgi:FAD-dependent urate hydroxylase